MVLLSLLAVPLVIGIAASVTRRIWWDRRAAVRHRQAIEVLGRITKEQAEAAGAVHGPSRTHSNLRVIPTGVPEPLRPPPRRRVTPSREHSSGPAEPPAAAPPVVPGGLPSRLPPAVPPPVTSRRVTPPSAAAPVAKAGPVASGRRGRAGDNGAAGVGTWVAGNGAKADGGQPEKGHRATLFFDDTPPDGTTAARPSQPRVASSRGRHVRPRRCPPVMAASAVAAIVLLGGGVTAWAALRSGGAKPAASHSTTPLVSVRPPSTTPVTQAAPPTTSLPPVTGPVAQSVSGQTVWVYRVPAAARLVLQASGPCWVQARQNDSRGPTVYMATLAPGQATSLSAPVWIRLGFPGNVALTVNGAAVSPPPAPAGAAYDVLVQT